MTTVTQSAKPRYSKAFAHINRQKNATRRQRKAAQKDTTMETTTTYKDASAAAWEREVYAQARALREAFPQLGDRLESAIILVRDGAVQLDDGGVPLVESRTEPGTYYRIGPGCTCPDAQFHAPHGRCAHRIAAGLYRKVTEALEATLDWQPEPPVNVPQVTAFQSVAPCPEAAFSVCLKGRRHGVDVMVTLRGQTRAELLHHLQDALDVEQQLDQLCGLFDEGSAVQVAPETPHATLATDETPRCPFHGPMKPSTKVPGSWFCSARMGDGTTYCKERFPK